MKNLYSKKAQSILEYAVCVTLVVLAVASISVYVKRSLQARYASVVKASVSGVNITEMNLTATEVLVQYEPYYHNISYNALAESNTTTEYDGASLEKDIYEATRIYNLNQSYPLPDDEIIEM